MQLYIVRHAFAGQHGDPRYPNDALRPLTDRGRKKFGQLVEKIAQRDFRPRAVATSPYVRCRQTAEIIADLVPGCAPPIELDALAPGSRLDALLSWTRQQGADHLAWVGHSPDVEHLAGSLIGDEATEIRFGKGTVAAIDFEDDEDLAAGQGILRWLVTTGLFA